MLSHPETAINIRALAPIVLNLDIDSENLCYTQCVKYLMEFPEQNHDS